jgi:uncharacterized lipoprotein YmbA
MILGLTTCLGACASAGFRYHTLIEAESGQPSAPATSQLRLVSVQVPAEVDAAQLVVRTSGNTLAMEPGDRWAAPLTDEIRGALDEAWRRDHGMVDVENAGTVSASVPRVGVQIQKMDSIVGEHVAVVANWWVAVGEGSQLRRLTCQSVLQEPAGADIDGLVVAEQRLFRSLASDVAGVVAETAGNEALVCPRPAAG